MTCTHMTAPTEFVEADGIRFAYRRFGNGHDVPLLFMPHYRAGIDHWDPAVTDGFAVSRPVILFDNTGVAGSSGETPDTMEAMADHAANFVSALGVPTVDVLGHSIGGYIAQTLAIRHPKTVRRLILVGTGPRGGEPSNDPKVREWGDSTDPQTGESSLDAFLYLFFSPSPASQAAGRAFWERRHLRRHDTDRPSTAQTMAAQRAAIIAWSKISGEQYAELNKIKQPTLVVNGNRDIMIPTINSYNLSQRIPQAQLIVYPDSGHGTLFQFPELFVAHGTIFLAAGATSPLGVEEARRIVAPLYDALNQPATKDVANLLAEATNPDYRSHHTNQDWLNRDQLAEVFKNIGSAVPDLQWAIKDIQTFGDQIVVRGEATGTPTGEFWGTKPTGKSFKTMAIDVFTVKNGRLASAYHVENWITALQQMAK